MKVILFALFVALLMGGCVRDRWVDYYDNGQKKW
jgi:PBP1b-binding outer membrane lipoprotein LpoB